MLLRKKLLLFTTLMTLIGLFLVVMGLNRILLHRFSALDESALRSDMNNILYSLSDELQIIQTNMVNYSAWDETYRFVQQLPNPNAYEDSYIQSNYTSETFSINKMDMIALLNANDQVIYGRQYDSVSNQQLSLSAEFANLFPSNNASLLQFSGPLDSNKGIVLVGGAPMLIVSLPIVTTNLEGSIQGTMIVGRMLDQEQIDRISERSHSEIHVQNISALMNENSGNQKIWFLKQPRNQVQVFASVEDIFGNPALVISTEKHRTVYESGRESVYTFAALLFVSVIITAIIGIAFINRSILSRITALVENIRNIGKEKDFSLRIQEKGNDEFTALENEFNRMMTSLEDAHAVLRERAIVDPLTGLYNRSYFYDKLNAAIEDAKTSEHHIAVLFIDLDNFKSVNDKWGHDHGDDLLIEVTRRIVSSVKPSDIVSRLGGDEFTILLSANTTHERFVDQAKHIHQALAFTYPIQSHLIPITASMGMSIYPNHGADAEELVNNADTAMFHGKKTGRKSMFTFSDLLVDNMKKNTILEKQLLSAVSVGEFEIHYQPIVTCISNIPMKLEALIRWNNPIFGLVPPSEFIPLAESIGTIGDIGAWVINRVCSDLRIFHEEGIKLKAAVNISVLQLEQQDLLNDFLQATTEHQIDPEWIELEITETTLMSSEKALTVLRQLRTHGFTVSLDDFGTGYSSLSYLRRFPVDTIKIDRSFISELDYHHSDKTLVKTIIDLGHNLGLKVVAEGVEDSKQLEILKQLGCDLIQGYFISKPMNMNELKPVLLRYMSGTHSGKPYLV